MMKKTSMVAITALIASSAFADDASKMRNNNDQMSDMRMQSVYYNTGPKLASARPQIDGYGWYLFGDFLWWNVQEGGTDWVLRDSDRRNVSTVTSKTYTNHDVDFGWNPGFRVGVGWNTNHDDWDTNFYYTWYQASRKESVGATGNEGTVPLMTAQL